MTKKELWLKYNTIGKTLICDECKEYCNDYLLIECYNEKLTICKSCFKYEKW